MLNTVKRVLPWQLNIEKKCTDCRHTEKYKNLRFSTVKLIMLKNSKNQCKKLLSLKHSVIATKVTLLKQQQDAQLSQRDRVSRTKSRTQELGDNDLRTL